MKLNLSINRFVGGEISPRLTMRSDYARYMASCVKLENFLPVVQGPVLRRGGTKFIAEVKDSQKKTWLAPFIFDAVTSRLLEFGDKYIRVYKNDELIAEIASPYSESDLTNSFGAFNIQAAQAADVVYLACDKHPPQKLSRGPGDAWTIAPIDGWHQAEREVDQYTAEGLYMRALSLVRGERVKTKDDEANGFLISVDGGKNFNPPQWGDPKVAEAVRWEAEAKLYYQAEVTRPNPSAVTFFRERLCFGAGNQMWLSASGAFEFFDIPPEDLRADDPIEINVYSEQANQIAWMIPAGNLLIGTSGGEFLLGEGTEVEPLGPANVRITPETRYGARPIMPIRCGIDVMFIMRSGEKMMNFAYNFTGNAYEAIDATVAAEHITRGGVSAFVYQAEPDTTFWLARNDGLLFSCAYNKAQEMNAWARHPLGGGGFVESLAVVADPKTSHDVLYLVVRRDIDGQTRRYIEKLTPGLTPQEAENNQVERAFFLDCGQTFEFEQPSAVISGLDYLEGCTVGVFGDGGVQPDKVVTGGQITIQNPAKVVTVGFNYTSFLKTVDVELNLPDGSLYGRKKRIIKTSLNLIDSLGGELVADNGDGYRIQMRRGSDRMDSQLKLLSGWTEPENWPDDHNTVAQIGIRQTLPLPLTLVGIEYVLSVGE